MMVSDPEGVVYPKSGQSPRFTQDTHSLSSPERAEYLMMLRPLLPSTKSENTNLKEIQKPEWQKSETWALEIRTFLLVSNFEFDAVLNFEFDAPPSVDKHEIRKDKSQTNSKAGMAKIQNLSIGDSGISTCFEFRI
jgi:hypothetical protein